MTLNIMTAYKVTIGTWPLTLGSLVQGACTFHVKYSPFNQKWEMTFFGTTEDKGHVPSYNEQMLYIWFFTDTLAGQN